MRSEARRPLRGRANAADFSKQLIRDTRPLLWLVTLSGLALSFLALWRGYTGALPWLTALIGLPWSAHGAICAAYLGMAKSDHRAGGITFEAAKQTGFQPPEI